MKILTAAALALIALTLAPPALAAGGPDLLNYQGVLRDSGGAPRQGTFDMRFRFFDTAAAGNELLIDEHLAAGTGGVVVNGGLFNVALGSGTVLDGSSAEAFSNLREVVGAHDAVYLEIQVAGETLTPRVRLLSAAYALNATSSSNASLLDSIDSSQFLRSDTSDTYTSGTLTTAPGTVLDLRGDTRVHGNVMMNFNGPDASSKFNFYDGGNPFGESFGWDELQDRFVASTTLRLDNGGGLEQTGKDVFINSLGPDASQNIYFYDTGEPTGQSISWDNPSGLFRLSARTRVGGTLFVDDSQVYIGHSGPDRDQYIRFFDDNVSGDESLKWDFIDDWFEFSNDLYARGGLRLNGDAISMNALGGDRNQFIRFYEDGLEGAESIQWDDAQDRFEMTDELAIQGVIRTGTTGVAPVGYNTIGSGTASSTDMTSILDLFVSGDLEVGDQLYMGGDNYLEWSTDNAFYFNTSVQVGDDVGENLTVGGNRLFLAAGPPAPGIPLHMLEFLSGTFHMNDDLDVDGVLTAGSKQFVQNHPYDPSLEVVYTSLEGPEATTFTRGSARLVGGQAHVPLESSFALTTHPDLGLTVSLTPRGVLADLYVVSVTTSELVVATGPDSPQDAAFDYHVMGLHVGYEESPVIRPKRRDAPLPDPGKLRESIADRPDLALTTPLARYKSSEAEVFGRREIALSAGNALRSAIGTRAELASATKQEPEAGDPPRSGSGAALAANRPASAPTSARVDHGADGASERTPRSVEEGASGTVHPRPLRPSSGGVDPVAPSVGAVSPGDVLAVDSTGSVRRAPQALDGTVVGIATGEPISGQDGASSVSFVVAGIVSCNVDTTSGPIRAGDLLVSSPNPGFAMRSDAPAPGTVVGKALEALPAGTGTIRVVVVLR